MDHAVVAVDCPADDAVAIVRSTGAAPRRFAYGVGHETMANAERQLTSVTQRPFAARQALRPSPIWEDVLLVRPAREAPRMLEPPT